MKRNMKKAVAIAFMLGMAAITSPVEAKESTATLSVKKADIALGTKGSYKFGKNDFQVGAYQIPIKKTVKGAKYVCTTSNKKIATATVKNNKINLTGLKAGKTTITCKQKVNGKTTVVGQVTVTVHNAKLYWETSSYDKAYGDEGAIRKVVPKNYKDTEWEGLVQEGTFGGFYMKWCSSDSDVKYSFKSNKTGLKVTANNTKIYQYYSWMEKKTYYINRRQLNTYPTKAGNYTVTLTETYKKQVAKSSAKATYYDAEVKEKAEFYVGQEIFLHDIATKLGNVNQYVLETENTDIYKKTDDSILHAYVVENGILRIDALKAGTQKVNVYYYDEEKKTKGQFLGTCEVTVKEAHTEQIEVDIAGKDKWSLEENNEFYLDEYSKYPFYMTVGVLPEYSKDEVQVTVSDESILKPVNYDEEKQMWYFTPLKEGEVTITVTSNGVTETATIKFAKRNAEELEIYSMPDFISLEEYSEANPVMIDDLYVKPSTMNDQVVLTSSDESILKVVKEVNAYQDEDYEEEEIVWKLIPLKAGEVTVTAEVNGLSKTFDITVD